MERSSQRRELAVPGVKQRTYHKHACRPVAHYDVCLLSDEEAAVTDCRNCRTKKFNAGQAEKASKPPAAGPALAGGLVW